MSGEKIYIETMKKPGKINGFGMKQLIIPEMWKGDIGMQRILNNADDIVDEMLKGFLKTHADIVEATENRRVIKAVDQGQGVVCLYGNYSGDNMNVKMAKRQGITVKTVVANDDVASAPKDRREERRGVAGEIFMWKAGGAKGTKGGSLDEVPSKDEISLSMLDKGRTIGIIKCKSGLQVTG